MRIASLIIAATATLVQSGVYAQETPAVLEGDFKACIVDNWGANGTTRDCLSGALSSCFAFPKNEAAGYGCFLQGREEFEGLINDHLAVIAERDNEKIAQIAQIEVKYDRLAQQIRCDRTRELNFLAGAPKPVVEYSHVQCEAIAVAQTFVQLLAKSGALPQ